MLGVLADLSGQPKEPLPKLKERKFVQIDRDNFDDVLKGTAPRLALRVDNKLKNDGTQLSIDLDFEKLEDFEPTAIVNQVAPLKQLLEMRAKLSDLRNKVMGNEKLEEILDDVLRDTEKLRAIAAQNPAK